MFERNEKEKHTFKESTPQLPPMDCEHCVYYVYDEEADEDFCDLSLDEDEEIKFLSSGSRCCPWFRLYDEYKTVRKQN